MRARGPWIAAGAALVVLGLAAVVVAVLPTGSPELEPESRAVQTVIPSPAAASPAPTTAGVAAAPPDRMVVPSIDFDYAVGVDSTPPGGEVEPIFADRPYWLSSYGAPGTDATNTVYIAGHSSGEGWAVFDRLLDDDLAPLDLSGQEIRLHTANGILIYVVTGPAVLYAKSQIADADEVWEERPGRLVVVTCDRNDRSRNIVFTAKLVSAIPA